MTPQRLREIARILEIAAARQQRKLLLTFANELRGHAEDLEANLTAEFTVIGFYEETGQTFAYRVHAADPHEAIRRAVESSIPIGVAFHEAAVLGAVPGHVQLTPACDESGNLAYACDLVGDETEVSK